MYGSTSTGFSFRIAIQVFNSSFNLFKEPGKLDVNNNAASKMFVKQQYCAILRHDAFQIIIISLTRNLDLNS